MNKWQIEGNEMPSRWAGRAPDSKGTMQTSIHPKKVLRGHKRDDD